MANVRKFTASFAGGEMSPFMLARFDDGRAAQGAQKVSNFITWPQGPAAKRPGFAVVNTTKDATKPSRLIPFSYGLGQSYAVELGEGYIRFHAEGATLLHAKAMRVASVDAGADSITFAAPHGLASNDAVVFFSDGGSVPAGLSPGVTYYAIPLDANTLQVSAFSGPLAFVDLLGAGTGTIYGYKLLDAPKPYIAAKATSIVGGAVTSVDAGTDEVVVSPAHGLSTGQPIRFSTNTASAAGVPGLSNAVTYFAIVTSPTRIKVALTLANAMAGNGFDFISSTIVGTPIVYRTQALQATAHGLSTGDEVRFTVASGTTFGGIEVGTSYSVTVESANVFRIDGVNLSIDLFLGVGLGATSVSYDYLAGDIVTYTDGFYTCTLDHPTLVLPGTVSHWHEQPLDGVFELPHDYALADLFDLHYAQAGDVMTIVHRNYPPAELTRRGPTEWSLRPVVVNTDLDTPQWAGLPTVYRGSFSTVASSANTGSPSRVRLTFLTEHTFQTVDQVYVAGVAGLADGFYTVGDKGATTVDLKTVTGEAWVTASSSGTAGTVQRATPSADTQDFYVVTAFDQFGYESKYAAAVNAANILTASGAFNTLDWNPVAGAEKYRVYKFQRGFYGFIGETLASETSFKDDNIGPDLGITLPYHDDELTLAGEYPSAVGYFEGRRVFAGGTNHPRRLRMSQVGYPSGFVFHIPVLDTDRVRVDIDARDSVSIRHVVPMTQLVLLTDSTEFRVSPVNTDAITPDSVSVRPQTYVGASMVVPVIVNGTVVFAANRGGHVREMAYRVEEGLLNGDLSMRASHLFDGKTIVDMTYQKAPRPIVWCVSSDGKLLGLTYAPEEGIGGWHQHSTDGTIESVCAVNDGGEEDSVYLVVKRTLAAGTFRFIERMAEQVQPASAVDWRYLDACVSFDGTDAFGISVQVTRATNWSAGSTVTVASTSRPIYRLGSPSPDIGDYVRVVYNGSTYRLRVTAVSTGISATAVILDTLPIATATTSFTATSWAWMRDTISIPSYLEGETVQVLADGALIGDKTVASGVITLTTPAAVVHAGFAYDSTLQLLPIALRFEAYAQGRTMNLQEVWVRHWKSSPFQAGAELGDDMATIAANPADEYGLTRELVFPGWNEQTTLWIRQSDPLPLTVVSVTTEVSIGS